MNGLYSKVDLTLQMFYHFWMTNRWLQIRFDFLSAFAIFTTSMFAISSNSAAQPGWAGWAALCITSVSYAFKMLFRRIVLTYVHVPDLGIYQ